LSNARTLAAREKDRSEASEFPTVLRDCQAASILASHQRNSRREDGTPELIPSNP
jgi:hypothetical protein